MPGHRPARLLLGRDRLRAGRAVRRVEVAEALPLVLPRPADLRRGAGRRHRRRGRSGRPSRSRSGSSSPSTSAAASSPRRPRSCRDGERTCVAVVSAAGSTPPCSPTTSAPTAGSCGCCRSTTASATPWSSTTPASSPPPSACRHDVVDLRSAGVLLAGSALTDDSRRRARRPLHRRVDAGDGGRQPQRHLRPGRRRRRRGRGRRRRRRRHPRRRPPDLPRLPARLRRGRRAPRPGRQRGLRRRRLPRCSRRSSHWSKADIVRRGAELGVPFADTWSCYKGGDASLRHAAAPASSAARRSSSPASPTPPGTRRAERCTASRSGSGSPPRTCSTASATTTRAPGCTATTTRSRSSPSPTISTSAGFVVDFGELDDVKRWIDDTLDHRHLNDVMEGQPSAEAIARLVHEWCRGELPPPVAAASPACGCGRRRRRTPSTGRDRGRRADARRQRGVRADVPGRGPDARAPGRLRPPRPLQPRLPLVRHPVHLGLGPVRPRRRAGRATGRRRRRRGRGDGRRPRGGHRRRAVAPAAPARCRSSRRRPSGAGRSRSRRTARSRRRPATVGRRRAVQRVARSSPTAACPGDRRSCPARSPPSSPAARPPSSSSPPASSDLDEIAGVVDAHGLAPVYVMPEGTTRRRSPTAVAPSPTPSRRGAGT